jgi:hypothetical protein
MTFESVANRRYDNLAAGFDPVTTRSKIGDLIRLSAMRFVVKNKMIWITALPDLQSSKMTMVEKGELTSALIFALHERTRIHSTFLSSSCGFGTSTSSSF